jgi:hypothetical protein
LDKDKLRFYNLDDFNGNYEIPMTTTTTEKPPQEYLDCENEINTLNQIIARISVLIAIITIIARSVIGFLINKNSKCKKEYINTERSKNVFYFNSILNFKFQI